MMERMHGCMILVWTWGSSPLLGCGGTIFGIPKNAVSIVSTGSVFVATVMPGDVGNVLLAVPGSLSLSESNTALTSIGSVVSDIIGISMLYTSVTAALV